jgi:opacity protein-like surface antigen
MKRVIWLIPAILCFVFCATAARAQEVPAWEVSGGYSYLRVNVKSPSYGLNGGYGSLTENLNSWFGGRIEVGAFTGTESGRSVSAQTITYGPVFSTHRYQKITPFAEIQIGVVHGSRGYLGISQDAFRFALAPAVGVDLKVNDRVAVRVQGDYLMTRFLGLRQDNLVGSVGLVVRLGRK